MTTVLRFAGIYNLLWGAAVILLPYALFDLTGAERPNYPQIWQCVGMVVGVYGVGYLIAARDPMRHWPIVFIGLLGKILGPIGFIMALAGGAFPLSFGLTIITNDLIWWAPFAMILWLAFRTEGGRRPSNDIGAALPVETALQRARTDSGQSILELSHESPVLLIFLRHAGCTFCKEALADVAHRRGIIESRGLTIILVHMSPDADAAHAFERYGLADLPRVSDPACELYRSLGLRRGAFSQLFGPGVALRGAAAALRGHWPSGLKGDGFRMPGVFLIRDGRILRSHIHATVADRPDYAAIADCELPAASAR